MKCGRESLKPLPPVPAHLPASTPNPFMTVPDPAQDSPSLLPGTALPWLGISAGPAWSFWGEVGGTEADPVGWWEPGGNGWASAGARRAERPDTGMCASCLHARGWAACKLGKGQTPEAPSLPPLPAQSEPAQARRAARQNGTLRMLRLGATL